MYLYEVIEDMHQGINTVADKVEYQEVGIPIIQSKNFTKGYLDLKDVRYLGKADEEKYVSKYNPHVGDILMANIGTIGKSFVVKEEQRFLIAWNAFLIKVQKEKVHPDFLKFYFDYLALTNYFDKLLTGGTVKFINKKKIGEILIPQYRLDEQIEIVSILGAVEKVLVMRQQEMEQLDNLIKSRFIELFGDPVDNPKGWTTKKLQDLVTDDCTISYGIVQTGDDVEEGIPVFRPVDIVNRKPVLAELKKTTKEISDKYKRTILRGREMLITVRANIADTCIVGHEFIGCNVGRGIVPIRTKENEMILEFLKYQIDSKHLNDNIKAMAKGITLIQLNMEDLREVALIVPPIEQQKAFVKFAEQVDKLKFLIQKEINHE